MSAASLEKLLALPRFHKRLLQIGTDLALIALCFLAAMWLRLEHLGFASESRIWLALLPVIPVALGTFWHFGLYRSVMRFITAQAVLVIGSGVGLAALTLAAMAQLVPAPIPRSVPAIFAILLFTTISGTRFLMRSLIARHQTDTRRPVIIYGAGEAGRQLQDTLLHDRGYRAVAFVDDDPALHGSLIGGRCVHPPATLPALLRRYRNAQVLLALPSASRFRRREIVATLENIGAEIRTMPDLADIVSGRAAISALRRVMPEDLLGRDPIPPCAGLMGKTITGKVVMVTGAGGSIGSELCRQIIAQRPARLVLLDASEYALYAISTDLHDRLASSASPPPVETILGSVQNPGQIRAILRRFGAQTIYHAAAHKHVALVETNVVEGLRNNVFGTKVVADAAADFGVEHVILISTDKAVRPANVMGASKRLAELICQAKATQTRRTVFSMVRFGNVLGSSGSVIPRFRAQIEKGGPVTVTHPDITRFFMTIPEAAQLVIQAGAMARGGDVFVLDMGEPVRILDLAQSMIRLHGLKPYLIDENLQNPAKRDMAQDMAQGDIGIEIVGLNKGDKLYEELLIDSRPQATSHPRILTATELSLPPADLDRLLDQLQQACLAGDLPEIHAILHAAPLGYCPAQTPSPDQPSALTPVIAPVVQRRRIKRRQPLRAFGSLAG